MSPLHRLRVIIFLLPLLAVMPALLHAEARYNTVYNRFSGLQQHETCSLGEKTLKCANEQASPLLLLDTTAVAASDYRFYVRLRNTCNAEGKSYRVAGRKQDYTEAGIVFRHMSDNDYWCATLHAYNSNPHDDMLDRRLMRLTVGHIVDGQVTEQRDSDYSKNFDLRGGYNVIGVEVSGQQVTVMAGENQLTPLMRMSLPLPEQPERVGCLVGPGALVELERTVLSFRNNDRIDINTGWTKEKLDAHFAKSRNPLEGYWQYLDRDMEDTWLRLGGRYTVAVVADSTAAAGTYNIIYMSGAEVKPAEWRTGMLKGTLSKTIFTGHYNATWIDATHRSMGRDVTASVENGVILTLNFPVYKSQVRFSKVISND